MGLDLRFPLGFLFMIIGGLLLGYGCLTLHSPMYLRSLGLNVNILWGGVMLLFGALMFLLARRKAVRISGGGTAAHASPAVPRRTH